VLGYEGERLRVLFAGETPAGVVSFWSPPPA